MPARLYLIGLRGSWRLGRRPPAASANLVCWTESTRWQLLPEPPVQDPQQTVACASDTVGVAAAAQQHPCVPCRGS